MSALSVVTGDPHPGRRIRVGQWAFRVGDLWGIVFRLNGLAWELTDVTAHQEGVDGRILKKVNLELRPFHIDGTRARKAGTYEWGFHVTPDAENTDDIALPHRGYATKNFIRIDPAAHHGVCATCESLWPCKHEVSAMDDRHREHMNSRPVCHHCGHLADSGMTIEFGPQPDPAAHLFEPDGSLLPDRPTLKVVTADLDPADLPPPLPPDGQRRGPVFHGKRGPCENAAYRYAAEHGWTLPPKNQDRNRRSWTIKATKGDRHA